MAAPDLEVIKDIPGYKVILKAVLKSQIQQLVEQLAATTEEESVILTANVADGTLSHLGSESGKGFLEDHEDIKSQFLGFCLKRYHKKQERQRLEEESALHQARLATDRHGGRRGPYTSRSPRFSAPAGSGPIHPIAVTHGPRGGRLRSPGTRHEPYSTNRPPRRTSTEPSTVGMNENNEQLIKTESNVDTNETESDTVTQDELGGTDLTHSVSSSAPSKFKQFSSDKDDDARSESSSASTIPNEPLPEGLGLDSDLSSTISTSNQITGEIDPNVTVKTEALNESEMELEITGIEPGRTAVPQDNWDPNVSLGMNYDPSGATGNQDDMAAPGYSQTPGYEDMSSYFTANQNEDFESQPYTTVSAGDRMFYSCSHSNCSKVFASKYLIERHIKIHWKNKPFACRFCNYKCVRKDYLRVHENNKHSAQILDSASV